MNTEKTIKKLIERSGSAVTVTQKGKTAASKAFIQPLFYKNKMYIDGHYLPQGYCDGGHYLYYGMPDVVLSEPFDEIVIGCRALGRNYTVKRAETHVFRDKPLYVWAVITPCGEGADVDETGA